MAFGFMMVFTAFMTCQNFASKVLSDYGFGDVGFISVAVLYVVFSICSFFSTAIVNKIGNAKLAMFIGALCYSFWIVCFILPAYYA